MDDMNPQGKAMGEKMRRKSYKRYKCGELPALPLIPRSRSGLVPFLP